MSEDRFFENDPVPLFLADPLEEAEQSGIRKVLSSDAFRKAILALGAAATLCAVVWVVNAIVFARVTASEPGRQASRDTSGQSTQAIPASNVAQASTAQASTTQAAPASASPAPAAPVTPPAVPLLAAPATQPAAIPAAEIPAAALAPPAGDDLLAAFKAAVENKGDAENKGQIESNIQVEAKRQVEAKGQIEGKGEADRPAADALLNQFKTWATEETVQAPARQPEPTETARAEAVQAARAEIAPPPAVPLPKRRPTHTEQAARVHELQQQNQPSLLRQWGFRN